jgi:hypothetical protein
MIVADETIFPNNIVEMVHTRCELIDPDLFVTKRPLRNTDPNQSIGVFASNWLPNDESKEFLGQLAFAGQPTLSTYRVVVQAFVKDMDEINGLNTHAALSRIIRSMLYTDQPLRVALSSLSSTLNGVTESSQRWGISQQRFFANELGGEWLYLSILEFWLETETR